MAEIGEVGQGGECRREVRHARAGGDEQLVAAATAPAHLDQFVGGSSGAAAGGVLGCLLAVHRTGLLPCSS